MWDCAGVAVNIYVARRVKDVQEVIAASGTFVSSVTAGEVKWVTAYIGQEHDSTNES